MKVKDGFILRKVADTYIIVAVGDEAVNFNAVITLNETGAFLWEKLEQEATEEDLIKMLLSEYDVDSQTAQKDVEEFIGKLKERKLLS